MKSFVPYLRSLATRPLRKARDEATDLGRLFRLLGELGDQVGDVVYAVRRAWLVATSPESGLALLGEARRLQRLPGEAIEGYRTRLLAAFETWQQGGTNPGVAEALALVGLPDADVHDVAFSTPWQFNGRVAFDGTATFAGQPHWAWFEVVAAMPGPGATDEDLDRWLGTTNRWKAGHAKLRRLALQSGDRMLDAWPLPADTLGLGALAAAMDDAWPMGSGVRFDGSRAFDGTWLFGAGMDSLTVSEEIRA